MPVISHQIVAVDLANGIGRHRSEGIFFGYGDLRNSMRLWEHRSIAAFCFVVLLGGRYDQAVFLAAPGKDHNRICVF